MKVRGFAAAVALTLMMAVGGVALSETPANAVVASSWCRYSSCSVYSAPNLSYYIMEIPKATPIYMQCWIGNGPYVNGTAKWFKVWTPYTGYNYWMNANSVSGQTTVGRC